jgi:hypothetical protein
VKTARFFSIAPVRNFLQCVRHPTAITQTLPIAASRFNCRRYHATARRPPARRCEFQRRSIVITADTPPACAPVWALDQGVKPHCRDRSTTGSTCRSAANREKRGRRWGAVRRPVWRMAHRTDCIRPGDGQCRADFLWRSRGRWHWRELDPRLLPPR